MAIDKTPQLLTLLELLSLDSRGWCIVDHWTADLCAVGIGAEACPTRLVYVSTYEMRPGRFYFECELQRSEEPGDFEVTRSGDDVSVEELLEVLVEHLG